MKNLIPVVTTLSIVILSNLFPISRNLEIRYYSSNILLEPINYVTNEYAKSGQESHTQVDVKMGALIFEMKNVACPETQPDIGEHEQKSA